MNTEFETLIVCKECGCVFRKKKLAEYSYECDCCGIYFSEDNYETINVNMIDANNNMTAEERLFEAGYEGIKYLVDYSYDDAIIGVTDDYRVVYDYEMMVEWLMKKESISAEDAIDWIEFNTMRALPYFGVGSPIVAYTAFDI